jgi:hypothetical protein
MSRLFALLLLLGMALAQSRLELVPAQSEARYRVREQLAGINFPTDAVGVSKQVQGWCGSTATGGPSRAPALP